MDFFTNTYDISITTHADLDEKKRPFYEFRAATIKERRKETDIANTLDDLMNPDSDSDVDDPIEYIEIVMPHIMNRLLSVRIKNKKVAKMMDLEETLDYTSIIELFWSMRNGEEFGVLLKKKLRSLSNSLTDESVKDAPVNAKEPQGKKVK